MLRRFGRLFAVIAFVAGFCANPVPQAHAYRADMYYEYYPSTVTGWRGIQGWVYNHNWTPLAYPSESHVSSIYVHQKPINFYEGDGYFDGQGVNFIHLEVGLARDHGQNSQVFYQYNYDPTGHDHTQTTTVGYITQAGYYGAFTIENFSMGNYSPENWRIKMGDTVLATFADEIVWENLVGPQFPMLTGEALVSSERVYLDPQTNPPGGDNGNSNFRYLKRKTSTGVWKYFQDSRPAADGDSYYRFSKVDGDDSYLLHRHY